MNPNILSPRGRAVGFAIVVSAFMLSTVALASVGAVVAPSSPSGGANASPTLTVTSASSVASSSGQTYTILVEGSHAVVAPSPSSPPGPLDSGPSLSFQPAWVEDGSTSLPLAASSPLTRGAWPVLDGTGNGSCVSCGAGLWFSPSVTPAGPNELLLLVITDYGETTAALTASDLSDGAHSTWTLTPANLWGGAGQVQYVFWTIDASAGLDTLVVNTTTTGTTASSASAVLFALKNVDAASPIDAIGSFATGTSSSPSASVATTVGGDLVVGFVSTSNGTSVTPSAGYTQVASVDDLAHTVSHVEDVAATTAGTYTSAPTLSGSLPWGEEALAVAEPALAAGTPTPTSPPIDDGQTVTLTANPSGGSGSYASYQWYSGASASGCTGLTSPISGATSSTYVASPTTSTYYCYQVTDSSSNNATSAADLVTVHPSLTVPTTPTPSATKLDADQALTVTGTIPSTGTPTYSWQWQVSVNGGAYAAATHCTVNSGSGASAGATETCNIAANTLTTDDNYTFALKVTDSASAPETKTSTGATPVAVSSALSVPATPTVSAAKLDVDQLLTVSGTIPATGTSTYSWQWNVSINAGAYGSATQCATTGGSGASGAAAETCSIAGGTLTAGASYTFELKVTDSATSPESTTSLASGAVTVKSALTPPNAPTPSTASLSATQPLTVTDTIPSTGTSTYSWKWLISIDGGTYVGATQCGASESGTGAAGGAAKTCTIPGNTLAASTSYRFELQVTDSATSAEVQTSGPSLTVTTTSALTAGTPTPTSPPIDAGQSITLTANPSGGSGNYTSYQWYSGASAAACTGLTSPISGATSSTYSASPPSNTYYCYKVTDSNSSTATSGADLVTVKSALTTPATPTPGATVLDVNQALSVTGTIPSTGTPTYSWEWLYSTGSSYTKATMCAAPSGTGAAAGAGKTCTIAANKLTAGDNYTFELQVNDSAMSPETATSLPSNAVAVSSALTVPGVPSVAAKLDVDQALTVTGTIPTTGSPTYSWQWRISINGSAYTSATQCASNSGSGALAGAPVTCSIAANRLTANGTYAFELRVTDGATVAETQTSGASPTVAVKSALSAPAAPGVSATALDVNQALTVTGTIPLTGTSSYQYEWLFSTGSGYHKATMCAAASGTGAIAGSVKTCAIAANGLTAGDNYTFELLVNDSATSPETATSSASSVVAVSSALTVPGAPAPSVTALDVDQALTVTGTIPTTGSPTYSWQWRISINGSAYASATQCTVNSGSGALGGATETCSIAANTLAVGATYSFELKVTDDATVAETRTSGASPNVTVSSALTPPGAPAVSATVLDADQPLTVNATIPSTGTSPYQYEWLYSTGSSYSKAIVCGNPSGSGAAAGAEVTCSIAAGGLTAGYTCTFELLVNDSSTSVETVTSLPSSAVTVSSPLTAPGTPMSNATALDWNQVLTVTGTIPSTGSPTYAWQWLVSINGSVYASATQCTVDGGVGATGAATETCSIAGSELTPSDAYTFELEVTDGATTAETQTSAVSATVRVASELTAPGAPTVSASTLDADQTLTVAGTIPSTGTPTYAWQWLVSVNGGAYGPATQCVVNSSTAAVGGATETCSVAANTLTAGDTYSFALEVTDSASVNEERTSLGSSQVIVNTPPAAPAAPTVSATVLDADQALTVSGRIPSTGTPTYSWQWLVSVNDGAYASATQCAVDHGSGALGDAATTCTILGGALTVGDTYAFELQVVDNATSAQTLTSSASSTLSVRPTLGAPGQPSPSRSTLDADQPLTVTGTIPSNGTLPYSWQWLISIEGASYVNATQCGSSASGSGAAGGTIETCTIPGDTLAASTYYNFELRVTDNASSPETRTSAASPTVTTSSALTAGTPTPSSEILDLGQSVTLVANPSGGQPGYTYQWYSGSTASGCTALDAKIPTATSRMYLASPTSSTYYCYVVTDAAHANATSAVDFVTVNVALTASATPTVSATALDADQGLTVTGALPTTGTPWYSWQWLVSVNGKPYSNATQCVMNSGTGGIGNDTETCVIPTDTLVAGTTYTFELQVTDSAAAPETQVSSGSSTVAVRSALTAPGAPTTGATTLDADQALTVTGTVPLTGSPTYSWQWLISVNGSAYAPATVCAVNSGTGAVAGATETCSIAGTKLAANDSYAFKLQVTDRATTAETETSAASLTVTVSSALTPPGAPTVSATALDADQVLTVTDRIPATGTPTYTWQWLVSINGGTYASAAQCAVKNGTGAAGDYLATCTISASRLTAGDSYSFELNVKDNASSPETLVSPSTVVTVSPALTAGTPTPQNPHIDSGQSVTLTASASGGTGSHTFQWYSGISAEACLALGSLVPNATSATFSVSPTSTAYYCYTVTDSATSPETHVSSVAAAVTVSSALEAPSAPGVSATTLDADQALTVTGTIPSTGTPTYSWEWLVSVNGGAYLPTTRCTINNGTGAVGDAPETCSVVASTLTTGDTYSFELEVTDSALMSESLSSASSATVAINPTLTPGSSTPPTPILDSGQSITLTASPSGGSQPYTYQWYSGSTASACVALGSPISGATLVTYSASPTTTTYYCYVVTDSNSNSQTSGSAGVTADPAPSISVAPSSVTMDSGQTVTLSSTVTGGTGTFSWQWYDSHGAITGASGTGTTATRVVSATDTGVYVIFTDTGTTDGATPKVTVTTSPTVSVTVNAAPTIPSPLTTNVAIDVGQTYTYSVTATGGTGTLSYTWTTTGLTVVSGCTSVSTTCEVSGSDASYTVSVLVGDQSQGTGNVYPSSSSALTVHTALTAPAAPSASATSLNANQGLTVTGLIPSTGTPTYAWQWLVSVNGGAYAPASQCAVNGGTGAVGGATETCSIAANTLTTGDTYAFELQVTDSATSPSAQTSLATPAVTVASPSTASSSSDWTYIGVIVGVLAAVILVALAVVLRRRQPRARGAPSVPVDQTGPTPPSGGAPPLVAPAYVETPLDVGQAPPEVSPAVPVGPSAGATGAPATADAESDFAALMAELDKISGEFRKKSPKDGITGQGAESPKEGDKS